MYHIVPALDFLCLRATTGYQHCSSRYFSSSFFPPPSHLLFSPFLSSSLLTQIRGHIAGAPLPSPLRSVPWKAFFYRGNNEAFPSLVDSRRIMAITECGINNINNNKHNSCNNMRVRTSRYLYTRGAAVFRMYVLVVLHGGCCASGVRRTLTLVHRPKLSSIWETREEKKKKKTKGSPIRRFECRHQLLLQY